MDKNSEHEENEEESPPSSITTYDGAINAGKDLLLFLTQKGEESLSEDMFNIIQELQEEKLMHAKQTSLLDYVQS